MIFSMCIVTKKKESVYEDKDWRERTKYCNVKRTMGSNFATITEIREYEETVDVNGWMSDSVEKKG